MADGIPGRCATCRWWEPEDEHRLYGACELTMLAVNYDEEPYQPIARHPDSKAVALGSIDDVDTWLYTEADFGCTQWKPADEHAD